jgi:neutral ceramidase
LRVGFSKIIITPDLSNREKPLQMAGYFPRDYCTGVNDDVYARGIFIEMDEDEHVKNILLISCDLIGLNNNITNIIRRKISEKLPIPFENIVICCTHTHSSVDYSNFFIPGSMFSAIKSFLFALPNHKDLLIMMKRVIKMSQEAYNNRRKAKIGAAQTFIPEEERVMINRRYPNDKEKAQYPITTIKVISDEENDIGEIFGIIFNYAIHGTVFPRESTLLSADWIGQAVKYIEDQFHPKDLNVIYFNGCCADINPMSENLLAKDFSKITAKDLYNQIGNWQDVQRIGKIVGKNALKIVDNIECIDYSDAIIVNKNLKIHLKAPQFGNSLLQTFWRFIFNAKLKLMSHLKKYVKNKGLKFVNYQVSNGEKFIITSIHVIYFANIAICSAPGEYFLELGEEVLKIAREITPNSFVVELANDSIGYIYPISEFFVGGYEPLISLAPMAGEIITMNLKKLLQEIKK